MVCVSPSPYAEKIVRTARRLADELNADWFVVYVEVATKPELNPANRARIDETLRLAETLGAKARTIAGHSIPEAVFAYAQKHNITKIVVGKPLRPRWKEWLFGSVVDQLVYASGDIDIFVISANAEGRDPRCRRNGGRTGRCCVTFSAWGWWVWQHYSACCSEAGSSPQTW